jgi:hypothetical protein
VKPLLLLPHKERNPQERLKFLGPEHQHRRAACSFNLLTALKNSSTCTTEEFNFLTAFDNSSTCTAVEKSAQNALWKR